MVGSNDSKNPLIVQTETKKSNWRE